MNSLAFSVGVTRLILVNLTRKYPGNALKVKTASGLHRGAVAFLFLGALASSKIVLGDDFLTLAEAQHRAVERSRQLSAQDSAALASREMAIAAGQLPDPVLRFGIDNLPINGPDQFSIGNDFMTQRRIGVVQEFTRSEKRQLRAERFEREADKYLAEKMGIVAAIQRDTALAWLDRYYAEAMAAAIAEQIEQVKREILAAESAYRAGRGSQADVIAAHGVLVGLEDRASEFNRRIATAKTGLARWIGEGADAPLGVRPEIDSIRLDSGSLESDLRHHPQIAVLSKQVEVAAADVRIAQANKKADWSIELSYSQRGSAYSNMVSLGVSVPLQWDQRQRQEREIASRMATTEQIKAQLEDMLRAHVAEVRSMIQEWENGRERLARYQRELVPISKERSKATLTAYQGGKASLGEVLLARRNETDVRLQALQLEMETARLWAQLNFLFPENSSAAQEHAFPSGSPARSAQ